MLFFLVVSIVATIVAEKVPSNENPPVKDYSATNIQKYNGIREGSTTPGDALSTESNLWKKRSINGHEVFDVDYPFVVGLHTAQHKNYCGGSVITKQLVLTAAHCVSKKRLSHVIVTDTNDQSKLSFRVDRHIRHPRYDANFELHDIGLLVLKGRIPNAPAVRLIPKSWTVRTGVTASAFGWGITERGTSSRVLRKVNLPVIDHAQCVKAFKFKANWICTDSHRRDICDGDSGGPLIADGFQVGIVSIGDEGCRTGVPSAFTAIAAYRDWIDWYADRYH